MKRAVFILALFVLLLPVLPYNHTAEANVLIPDIEVEISPGYLVLDVSPGGSPTGQVVCSLTNPSVHQVTVRGTISVDGFVVTPRVFTVTLAGGGDISMPIAVSATPWEVRRGVATMTAEIERQDGLPGVQPKSVHATFIIAAPPFGRPAIHPPEIHVPDEGWYQRTLSVTSNATFGQYFDVSVATDSQHFRVERSSSRVFLEAGGTIDYLVLVWCGKKDADGEMTITFTPDYGSEETIKVALNKGEWELDQLPKERDSAPPPVEMGLLLILVVFLLLVVASSPTHRGQLKAFSLVLLLVFSSFLVLLPNGSAASSVVVNPYLVSLSRDQLFYQFTATISNDNTNEKTYRLTITGARLLFAYSAEWVVPAQGSVTVPVLFMKDFYQPLGSTLVDILLQEIANEGVAILPITYQITTGLIVSCPGDDFFHGTLDPEEYVRAEEGGSREIAIQLQASLFKPRLVLVTEDKETGNWEQVKELLQEEDTQGETRFSCQLEKKEVVGDQLYAVRLFCSENDTDPIQTIHLVFAKGDDDDSGPLSGFELAVALLVFITVVAVAEFKKKS